MKNYCNNTKIDIKALNQWNKSSISYNNYQNYINKKKNKFKLTLIDLLYVSNFKGGNATINEHDKDILKKLMLYSNLLFKIKSHFKEKKLADLNENEIAKLMSYIDEVLQLANKKNKNRIDGFNISFLSALMSSYSPNLIPILDRRLLINLNLVTNSDVYKSGQIKNIQKFYYELINITAKNCKTYNLSLREFDQKIFSLKLSIASKKNKYFDVN